MQISGIDLDSVDGENIGGDGDISEGIPNPTIQPIYGYTNSNADMPVSGTNDEDFPTDDDGDEDDNGVPATVATPPDTYVGGTPQSQIGPTSAGATGTQVGSSNPAPGSAVVATASNSKDSSGWWAVIIILIALYLYWRRDH